MIRTLLRPARWALPLAFLVVPETGGAQTLARRAEALGEGTLRLSFTARAGVCGDGGHGFTISDGDEGEWERDCTPQPVRVSLQVRAGRVTDAHTYVGGRWRAAAAGHPADLGRVPAGRAAAELLALIEERRTDAQAVIVAAARGLDSLVEERGGDLEVREHAVFALSQRPASEGVPILIRIARTNPHPALRRTALFWLGQSEDPRALALFEELLR